MRKGLLLFTILTTCFSFVAQEKKKDTVVQTEIVNVITKYNPEIADVFKISKKPTLELSDNTKKKKLNYTIFSAPVASTFIPKTGVVKGINVGLKERIYNNYLAMGYGNYKSPFLEMHLQKTTRFKDAYGIAAKYIASNESINNTLLNSTFYNFNTQVFYKKEARLFDWKVTADTQINNYNWYGLPNNTITNTLLHTINPEQTYKYGSLTGNFKFHDSYIEYGNIELSYFTDSFKSNEILVDFESKLNFPLDFLSNNLNDISLTTGLEYLRGNFTNNYSNTSAIDYNIFTLKVVPEYKLDFLGYDIKAGLKTYLSLDIENTANTLLVFPDIFIQKSILKKQLNLYGGITGDLHTNTYQNFIEENPYVSPTLLITQTAEKSNIFMGLKGNISNSIGYNFMASTKKEEDKPLFLRNNSKFNSAGILNGYEYGNSFKVFYDDVTTTSFFGELSYNNTKDLNVAAQLEIHNYKTANALENWNLPTIQAHLITKYNTVKWYAISDIFYLGERKDAVYNSLFPSSLKSTETIDSILDVNIDAGYHITDKFSTFISIKNALNTNYQRFANFNVQGFQILGGLTYKFDF